MEEEENKEKKEESHHKQIQAKAKEHSLTIKDIRSGFQELVKLKHAEDWGETKTMEELGKEFQSYMNACTRYYADSFALAEAAGKFYLTERLKAPVMGEGKSILKNFIDEWVKHVATINSDFTKEMLISMEHGEKEAHEKVFGSEEQKKGIIKRSVGKMKDTTVNAADRTARLSTFNVVKLKERREIK